MRLFKNSYIETKLVKIPDFEASWSLPHLVAAHKSFGSIEYTCK